MDQWEADAPSYLMSFFSRGVKSLAAVALLLSLIGCWGASHKPHITMPKPKVYTDDQVLKTFSERRTAIRDTVKGISTDTIQELLRVKQQSQTTINVSTTPAGSATPSSTSTPPSLPSLPALSDISTPNNFGLTAESSLRKRIALDQNITAYELLYLGDNDLLSKDKQVVLVRIDLSVRNFTRVKSFLGYPQFVLVGFSAMVRSALDDEFSNVGVSVYALEPEFTSVVAQESLLSSRVENYAAQALAPYQGGTITGSGAYQRSFEEGLLSLVEMPLQYSIYTNDPNRFAFAFGPRRRINKRSWINPQRIFGETYDIQYELEPGSRSVYALLVLPNDAEEIQLAAYVHHEFVTKDLMLTGEVLTPLKTGIGQAESIAKQPAYKGQAEFVCGTDSDCHSFNIPILRSSTVPHASDITPKVLYAGVANQFFITHTEPITSETEVFIGSVSVPKSNVTVLGRYRLKVSLPNSKEMDDAIKNAQGGIITNQEVILVTPDRDWKSVGKIDLRATRENCPCPK